MRFTSPPLFFIHFFISGDVLTREYTIYMNNIRPSVFIAIVAPMTISVAIAGATGYVDAEFLAEVTHKGDYLRQEIEKLPLVERVRGRGLMLGVVLAEPVAKQAVRGGLAQGLILNAPSENVLRLTPPLVISHDELDTALTTLRTIMEELA